ncbi:MAG: sulfatase [Planctomycetota bacterium]
MNFIVVVSDSLRRDHLGCYGNKWISTPHIDRFASRALMFERAYIGSFPTVPHRRDLLTGRFASSYTGWAPLGLEEIVLPEVLGKQGYASMMVCDCPHILKDGYHYDRGFDGFEWIRGQESDRWKTYPEAPEHPCDVSKIRGSVKIQKHHRRNVADWRKEADRFVARSMTVACEWLEQNYKRDNFFLYVDTFDPHEPWDAPQWYVDKYDPGYNGEVIDYPLYSSTDFLSEAELKHCKALYAAEVTLVDRWAGRLFAKIEDLGLFDNTMVLFTSDHGFLHGEHGIIGKCLLLGKEERPLCIPLYEEISHIPLLISCPGASAGRSPAIVQPMDIMPTMLELAGAGIPGSVHGKSFAGILSGREQKHRDFAVSAPFLKEAGGLATVVKDKYTAVFYPSNKGEIRDKSFDGYYEMPERDKQAEDLLFDLSELPVQENSIAGKHPEIMTELRKDLLGFLAEINTSSDIVALWRGTSK